MTAAKPTELKRRLGNPGKRSISTALTVIEPAVLTDVPEHLGDAGGAVWRDATTYASAWIGTTDRASLLTLCELYDRRAILLAFLASEGYSAYTDKGYAYLRPEAGMLTAVEEQIRKWSSLLGLTPSDRSRLGVAEVKAASTLERLRASRAGRPAT